MRAPTVTAEDVTGIVGIVPTPALDGADRAGARDTVNLDESARMADLVVRGGTDVLLTNGTFGEGASLMWDELQAFVDTVVQTVAGRIPVFSGATTLNTRDTIERGARLAELGVDGLFLGRPMWVSLDDQALVRYYRDVAEALPSMAIVVYDNPGAFKGKISPRAYAELSRISQVVAAKHVGLFGGAAFMADLRAVEGRIRLLPIETDWHYLARLFPDQVTACWSGNVACGPAPLVALRDAIRARDWDESARVGEELEWALGPLYPEAGPEAFLRYSIRLDNAEFEAAGFITPGPVRPPYSEAPEPFVNGAREAGHRWAKLQERYATGRSE